MNATPERAAVRRSPIDAWYAGAGEGARVREGMQLPARLKAGVANGHTVTLTDCSWRRRFGVKGPGAPAWLEAQGYPPPASPNSWHVAGGALIARLATSEFLIEDLANGQPGVTASAAVLQSAARPPEVFPVTRQDLVVELRGAAVNDLLRQVCSVDFAALLARPGPASDSLVLTTMAGVAVLALVRDRYGASELVLWADPSFAPYFWGTLVTVATELGGGVLIDEPTGA